MSNQLIEVFGEGNVVGYYRVNHLVPTGTGYAEYISQVIDVRDNGLMTVYDDETDKRITSFMASRDRVEVTLLLAGQIPDEDWLDLIGHNRAEAERLNLLG